MGFFLLALTVGAFWEGGQSLYTALGNRQPTTLGYDEYVQQRPQACWLQITNCMLDLTKACYKSYYGGKPTELFIPVRSAGAKDESGKIHVVFDTSDPAQLNTVEEMRGLNSRSAAVDWMLKNKNRVYSRRNISGLVRFGIKLDDKDRRKLASLLKDGSDDLIILQDGQQPSLAAGVGFSLVGVMLVGGFVVYLRHNRETTTDAL